MYEKFDISRMQEQHERAVKYVNGQLSVSARSKFELQILQQYDVLLRSLERRFGKFAGDIYEESQLLALNALKKFNPDKYPHVKFPGYLARAVELYVMSEVMRRLQLHTDSERFLFRSFVKFKAEAFKLGIFETGTLFEDFLVSKLLEHKKRDGTHLVKEPNREGKAREYVREFQKKINIDVYLDGSPESDSFLRSAAVQSSEDIYEEKKTESDWECIWAKAYETLSPRERQIVKDRNETRKRARGDGDVKAITQDAIAKALGISKSRVGQIEERALRKFEQAAGRYAYFSGHVSFREILDLQDRGKTAFPRAQTRQAKRERRELNEDLQRLFIPLFSECIIV